jgi:hypothetical protein
MKNVIKILKLFSLSVLSGIVANFAVISTYSLCYGGDITNVIGVGFPFVWLSTNHPIAGYYEIYLSNLATNVGVYTLFSLVAIRVFKLGNSVVLFLALLLALLLCIVFIYVFSLNIEVAQYYYSVCK